MPWFSVPKVENCNEEDVKIRFQTKIGWWQLQRGTLKKKKQKRVKAKKSI
jgi:hypothetical protein